MEYIWTGWMMSTVELGEFNGPIVMLYRCSSNADGRSECMAFKTKRITRLGVDESTGESKRGIT